jgi:hypothetical protein
LFIKVLYCNIVLEVFLLQSIRAVNIIKEKVMKIFLKSTLSLFMLTIFGFGQDSEVYQARVWHAKPMKADAMVEAMTKKSKKYNKGNKNYPMNTFEIISGKDQGGILRVSGTTFEDRDKYPLRKNELDYWMKNVMPHVDLNRTEGTSFWSPVNNQSYNGSGGNNRLRFQLVTEYLIKPAKLYEWNQLRIKLVEAHKKAGSKARFDHYNRFAGGKTHLVHMIVPFNSWADYEKRVPIFSEEIFNNAHGKGAHKKWLNQISEIIEYREVIIREHLPELSTN